MTNHVVAPATRVQIHFSVALETGEQVDSNFGKAPAVFTPGDGNFLPGFDELLIGLSAGDRRHFVVAPEHAFGAWRDDNVHRFPRHQFAADIELTEGLMLSFADPQQAERPGVVRRVFPDTVEIDFNHPLAGKTLLFDVEIVTVEKLNAD